MIGGSYLPVNGGAVITMVVAMLLVNRGNNCGIVHSGEWWRREYNAMVVAMMRANMAGG